MPLELHDAKIQNKLLYVGFSLKNKWIKKINPTDGNIHPNLLSSLYCFFFLRKKWGTLGSPVMGENPHLFPFFSFFAIPWELHWAKLLAWHMGCGERAIQTFNLNLLHNSKIHSPKSSITKNHVLWIIANTTITWWDGKDGWSTSPANKTFTNEINQ